MAKQTQAYIAISGVSSTCNSAMKPNYYLGVVKKANCTMTTRRRQLKNAYAAAR